MPLKFYYPSRGTVPVSVTGTHCALKCKHCNAVALKHMLDASRGERLWEIAVKAKEAGMNSLLVSGGSNARGEVPVWEHVDTLRKIREELGLKVNAHVGLIPKDKIPLLRGAVDVISLDIPPSDKVIEEIYGLNERVEDYFSLFLKLSGYYRVVPHITTLLYYGRSTGEYRVIEELADLGITKLIVNVFMPLPGTPMQYVRPNIEEAVDIMRYAARHDWELVLGCMRPRVRRLELIALEEGFEGIVQPSRRLEREINAEERNYCCALD
ncbi:MAG TPA: hypothetical protein ENF35_01055 [Aciduliprofundum sp.]|nr:hypothetical protein [Aciduliprofundum sp.]